MATPLPASRAAWVRDPRRDDRRGCLEAGTMADTCASASRSTPFFAINGRFFSQDLTGVQRYGREIVAALDPLLLAAGREATLMLPRRDGTVPPFRAIAARPGPAVRGQVWEQGVLPAVAGRPLLNLCNTAPVALRRQAVCLHDTNVFTAGDSYRTGFRLFYRTMQPLLARRALALTTVSAFSAGALAAQFGLKSRHISVLPNGHEHALGWERDWSVLARHGLYRPYVLLLGSRARHKNMALLLRLAPALDALGLDLVVAGCSGSVFTAAAATGGGNVKFIGRITDGELAGLLPEALCLAFPSWTEGFGLPIIEAMALGCPVIASDRASMPEVCGGAALLAAPDDPVAWLRHVAALQGSALLREDLRARGRAQARRFSWTESARGYLELMERLA